MLRKTGGKREKETVAVWKKCYIIKDGDMIIERELED
jgi:hypothetical protein